MAYPNPLPIFLISATFISLLISPGQCSTNAIYSALGGKLATGESLVYREYSLTLNSDCNLVLYADQTLVLWETGTANKGRDCYLILDSNGELNLFGHDKRQKRLIKPIWTSGVTSTEGSYALVLRYDGTLNVYGPSIWMKPDDPPPADSTEYYPNSNNNIIRPTTADSILWSGDIAPRPGVTIVNGAYVLELEDRCNLTLTDTKTGDVLWHTDTEDKVLQDCYVQVGNNGQFWIKVLGGVPLWTGGVSSVDSDYVLALRPDGKLVVYGPTIWSSASGKKKIAMVTAA